MYLLFYIDDATSRLMHLQLIESESTFDYFAATRAYQERYGKPVAFYFDKHGVFRVNKKDAVGGDGMTQFGRALHALNIDIICANSSQAKGRVERANGTLRAGGCNRRHHRGRGVDLQCARRVGHRAGEIGTVARRVLQRCPVQVERRHRQIAGVLSGANS